MSHRSDGLTLGMMLALQEFDRLRFYSEKDETYLVALRCGECGCGFQELYDHACECVISSKELFCIRCDDAAEEEVPAGKLSKVVQWWVNL